MRLAGLLGLWDLEVDSVGSVSPHSGPGSIYSSFFTSSLKVENLEGFNVKSPNFMCETQLNINPLGFKQEHLRAASVFVAFASL